MRPMVSCIIFLGLAVGPSLANARLSKTGTPSVVFNAVGPAGLRIEGKTNELEVAEVDASVKVTVPLAALDTGIGLRNKHMREKYLETAKYPNAELVVARSALQFPGDGAELTATAPGQLTIHGQSKPATIRYRARRAGTSYSVQGTTHINMGDFGIAVPSYLGVSVKPEIDLTVTFSANDS